MTSLAQSVHAPTTSSTPATTSNSTNAQSTPSSGTGTTTAATTGGRTQTTPVSYAAATKKTSYTPPIVSSGAPNVGGSTQGNPSRTNASPVNGKPTATPAVPTGAPTSSSSVIVNGAPNNHSRKSSIVSGGNAWMQNGNHGGRQQQPNTGSIQFGSLPGNQSGSGAGVSSPSLAAPVLANQQAVSPHMSPAPLAQPAVSGGPVAQAPRSQNIIFGDTNGPDRGDQRHGRPSSMPVPPVAPAAQGGNHGRRESATSTHGQHQPPHPDMHHQGMPSHRGGMSNNGGRRNQTPTYNHQYAQQQNNYNGHNNYQHNRNAPNQGRGGFNMQPQQPHYSGVPNQMQGYPSPRPPRSPAVPHAMPLSVPTTPQMNTVPMAAASPSFSHATMYTPAHQQQQHHIPPTQPYDQAAAAAMYYQQQQFQPMYTQGYNMPPGSPRNHYQQMGPPYPMYQPIPPAMSRSSSQAGPDIGRPGSAFQIPHTPMAGSSGLPHQTPPSSSPGLFKKPERSIKAIKIVNPTTGAVLTQPETPKKPVVVSSSPGPGPVIVSSSPRPPQSAEKQKSDEEKRRELVLSVQKKKEEDEAREKELKRKQQEEEDQKKQAAEAEEKKKQEEEAAAKAKAEEEEKAKKEAEEKARLEEEERKQKEEEETKRKEEAERIAKEKAEADAKAAEEKRLQDEKEAAEKLAKETETAKSEPTKAQDEPTEAVSKPEPVEEAAKPVEATSEPASEEQKVSVPKQRGAKPSPLVIKTSNEPGPPSAALTALRSARFIDDINSVKYPPSIMSPNPALNPGAPLGKFKYHKDFLLQFQNVFTEKPSVDWDQRIKDTVGEPTDSARPMTARMPTGGGLGARNPSHKGSANTAQPPMGSLGAFGSGKFGSFNTPPSQLTSAERFAQSNRQASGSGSNPLSGFMGGMRPGGTSMSRQNSSTGLSQQPGGGFPQSPRASNKGSQRQNSRRAPGGVPMEKTESKQGEPKPIVTIPLSEVKPLAPSSTGWKPRIVQAAKEAGEAPGTASMAATPVPTEDNRLSPEMVQRKVKAALNKMTPEKFDKISNQILDIANQSKFESDGRTLRQVIQLTFEKATDEAAWSSMYAKFCKLMLQNTDSSIRDEGIVDRNGVVASGGSLFRKYLLNRCQEEFERGWKVNLPPKPEGETDEAAMLSDEYYIAAAAKRRGLGLIQFIGELFKLGMLTERIMHECVKKLVDFEGVPEEAEVESLCKLLRTIGATLDSSVKGRPAVDSYFDRINQMTNLPELNSRLRFMLMDVIDLRKNGWPGEASKGPKTIQEIHDEAKAQAEKDAANRAAQQAQRRPQGQRGDSRQGQFGYGNQNDYRQMASNTLATGDLDRLRQKATRTSTAAPSFGPASFARTGSNPRKIGGPSMMGRGDDSANSSRTQTPAPGREATKNMFELLGAHTDNNDNDATSPTPSATSSPLPAKAQLAMRSIVSDDKDKESK